MFAKLVAGQQLVLEILVPSSSKASSLTFLSEPAFLSPLCHLQ
jgi:hypothetical protein